MSETSNEGAGGVSVKRVCGFDTPCELLRDALVRLDDRAQRLAGSEAREREWREKAEHRARQFLSLAEELRTAHQHEAVLVEALKELVRLKEIKGNLGPASLTPAEYEAAKEKAWQVARSLIAGVVEAEPDGSER